MEDSKFNALVRLLDDTDPEVFQQVESEICNLGLDGVMRLEKVWETTSNEFVQYRLEELIGKIQGSHFTDELFKWRKGGGVNLIDGWLLLTQLHYPTMNSQKCYNEINRMVNKIWLQHSSGMNDVEKLCVVNKMLYQIEHYGGNYNDPDNPENNYLSSIIESRKGNSLSMSALYYIICDKLQIPLQVVNFQGYYALRYYSRSLHFYIDAYNKGIFFTPIQVQQFLNKLNNDDKVTYYKPLSNIYIILNIIETIIANYKVGNKESFAEKFEKLLKDIDISFDSQFLY